MSKVEWKTLGDICQSITAPKKLKTNEYFTQGKYMVIDQGKNKIAGYTNDDKSLLPYGEYILYGDHTCEVKYVHNQFAQGADGLKILKIKTELCKYVYYALCRFNIESNEYKRHWLLAKEIVLPLPLLDVQRQIVSQLDTFTTLIAKLESELTLRQKQYEFYREKLLNFDGDEEVEWKTLGEIGTFVRGNGIKKSDFSEQGLNCIHYGQIYTSYEFSTEKAISKIPYSLYSKCKKASYGDIILATTSENIADVGKPLVWLGKEEVAVSTDAFIFHHNQLPKYIGYLFLTYNFFRYKHLRAYGTKVIRISGEDLASFLFPCIPLGRQQQIVSQLDTFEQLIAALKREIALRRKQYDYYREKLLTFE